MAKYTFKCERCGITIETTENKPPENHDTANMVKASEFNGPYLIKCSGNMVRYWQAMRPHIHVKKDIGEL